MSTTDICILSAFFFLTSVLSVVAGSTSLITVPAMISLGMEAQVAVATNMLALTFMSIGGSVPLLRNGSVRRTYLPTSILLTVVGSGAWSLDRESWVGIVGSALWFRCCNLFRMTCFRDTDEPPTPARPGLR
jgi:uncharacterized membrane protein YfcA